MASGDIMINLFKVVMSNDVDKYILPILRSGYIGEGEEVEKFEGELRVQLGMETRPISTNSCTSAIHLTLLALRVRPGDEVITTPMTCVATNNSIPLLGARPVWADVDPMTGNISPKSVEKLITSRTKAIIAVDWTGRSADYNELKKLGDYDRNHFEIPVIQDAAHNPFIDFKNCGNISCLSFGPIKHLTSGDGGAVLLHGDYIFLNKEIRLLRWYGLDRTSSKDFRCAQDIRKVGSKFHMNNINASIGRANLPYLKKIVEKHRSNAKILYDGITNRYIKLPPFDPLSGYWVFPILVKEREKLTSWLLKHGIESSQVHARNDKHTDFNYPAPSRLGLEEFDSIQLNIPCGSWLEFEDLKYIINFINNWNPFDERN
jgi:perosamine synthetase